MVWAGVFRPTFFNSFGAWRRAWPAQLDENWLELAWISIQFHLFLMRLELVSKAAYHLVFFTIY